MKDLRIHWSTQHEWRHYRAAVQASLEGYHLPMPMRHLIDQANTTRAAATKPHHGDAVEVSSTNTSRGQTPVGDKHQSGRVKLPCLASSAAARGPHPFDTARRRAGEPNESPIARLQ